jgi:hypothetical protein
MKIISKSMFGLMAFGIMLLISGPSNLVEGFIADAEARVGRPLTPVSVGGVARRTTRRSVYTAAAVTTTAVVVSQPSTVVVEQPVTVVQQASPLPTGSIVPSLPSGCNSKTVNNVSYFSCGGNWYKPAMQEGVVVYEVVANPS